LDGDLKKFEFLEKISRILLAKTSWEAGFWIGKFY
jgi:hypothetical protein